MAACNLSSLLTPSLLTTLADTSLAYSKKPINFADTSSPADRARFVDACKSSNARDALVALSRLSPDGKLPSTLTLDLFSFLPDPLSPEFPKQCHGLQLLLDQAPRVLFNGIDERWQSAYFGPLGRQLAGQWYALPAEQRPDGWSQGNDRGMMTFEHWVISRVMWSAPFLHSEDLESQKIGLELAEETRAAVETHTGVKDPYRATRDALLKDDLVFLREVVKGPPMEDGNISISAWAFWWSMIKDAHWPIIEHFGRYPYRNAILGRESTPEEKTWLDATGHFSEAPPDIAARVREDVRKGVITPLGK